MVFYQRDKPSYKMESPFFIDGGSESHIHGHRVTCIYSDFPGRLVHLLAI